MVWEGMHAHRVAPCISVQQDDCACLPGRWVSLHTHLSARVAHQGERVPGCAHRSTARVSTGQRVSLNSVEEAASEEREGHKYWVYEHLSQVNSTLHDLRPPWQKHPPIKAAPGARVDS